MSEQPNLPVVTISCTSNRFEARARQLLDAAGAVSELLPWPPSDSIDAEGRVVVLAGESVSEADTIEQEARRLAADGCGALIILPLLPELWNELEVRALPRRLHIIEPDCSSDVLRHVLRYSGRALRQRAAARVLAIETFPPLHDGGPGSTLLESSTFLTPQPGMEPDKGAFDPMIDSVISWSWDVQSDDWQASGWAVGADAVARRTAVQALAMVHAADRDRFRDALHGALKGRRFLSEFRVDVAPGDTRWFVISGAAQGDGRSLFGQAVDVSRHKHAVAALAESQHRLHAALEASRMCWWRLDPRTRRIEQLGPTVALFGQFPSTVEEARRLIHPADLAAVQSAFLHLQADSDPVEVEFRTDDRRLPLRWLRLLARCTASDGARFPEFSGWISDVTEHRREQELQTDLNASLTMALDVAGLSQWSVNLKTGFHSTGPRDIEFFGELITSTERFLARVHPADLPSVQTLTDIERYPSTEAVTVEYRVVRKDREIRWLVSRAQLQRDADGTAARLVGVTFDVSARRLAELRLEDKRRRLNETLQAGGMLLWQWQSDHGFRIEYGAADQMFRWQQGTAAFVERILPHERDRVRRAFTHSLKYGLPYSEEFGVLDSRGETRIVHIHGVPYHLEESGASSGMRGALIDVTDRRKTERELAQTSERLVLALKAAGMTLFDIDVADFLFDSTNPMLSAFGAIAQEDEPRVRAALEALVHTRNPMDIVFRLSPAGAEICWRRAFGRIEVVDAGAATRIVGVAMDITKQKAAEGEIGESRHWHDLAVATAHMGLWRVDLLTGDRTSAQIESEILGRTPPSLDAFRLLIHHEDCDRFDREWHESTTTGTAFSLELRVHPYGDPNRTHWIGLHGRPLRHALSGRQLMIGLTIDIDLRKKSEAEVLQALELARSASEAKSAFLASMSHEIRTPLNAVIGYTGLLADSGLDTQQSLFVSTLKSSALQLLGLINDILDFSRIEAGELPLEVAPFDLVECVEQCLDLVAPDAEAKGLCLLATLATNSTAQVAGDVTRVRQILVNLLNNAVKFTDTGGVTCAILIEDLGDEAAITITVSDTGIGLRAEVVERLFQPFQQGDASTTRRFGGTGLGLSISRRLAQLMGGSIGFRNLEDRGCRFDVELRLPWASAPESISDTGLPRRVGIAARSSLVCRALDRQLRTFGIEPVSIDLTDLPDGLCRYPNLDALIMGEPLFTAVGKDQPWPMSDSNLPVPAIVLVRIERARGEEIGLHSQPVFRLSRALKPSQLLQALKGIGSGNNGRSPATLVRTTASAFPPEATRSLKVLVAEDNSINQLLLCLQLKSLGHQCQAVGSGEEAIHALLISPFDAILMDVEMPGLDGIQTAQRIRAHPKLQGRQHRIVAVTAHATSEMRQRVIKHGMDDFVSKPIVVSELARVLNQLVETQPPRADQGQ